MLPGSFRKIAAAIAATALVQFAPLAQAALWSYSFTDMGVDYTLTFDSLSGNTGNFTLTLNTTGYNQKSGGYLDSVDVKAWDGSNATFTLLSAPNGTGAWTPSGGPISSGPVSNTGCKGTSMGFICVEAKNKGVFDVASGSAYTFSFAVTNAGSFMTSGPTGAHIGAGYADRLGRGAGYGITSHTAIAPIPEPETYAMLIAGMLVLAMVGWRRSRGRRVPVFAFAGLAVR